MISQRSLGLGIVFVTGLWLLWYFGSAIFKSLKARRIADVGFLYLNFFDWNYLDASRHNKPLTYWLGISWLLGHLVFYEMIIGLLFVCALSLPL